MANSSQARKRARQSEKRRMHNTSLRSRMRTSIKRMIRALDSNDVNGAQEASKRAFPLLDSASGKNLIHKNKAARHKKRLNARLKALASA
ncbi:30S ribosomal protein S20 [Thioalkalivibrio sp. HK1]|uniref:30S ribosomal protein S20 n=1 Tax=Thioalkalivibrio sp. HK1 TaxID=1469245 RepID=UPI0009DDC409|nr:30S ribosomal protein S20 [Thioalkalivibrio sp. HK1]